MDDDPLERLAASGRRMREEDVARERHARRDARVEEARARAERVRTSVSAFARWQWWLAGAIAGLAVMGSLFAALTGSTRPDDESTEVPFAFATLASFVPLLLAKLMRASIGDGAVQREKAWLAARPFRVTGFFEALGSTTTEGTAALTIRFADVETVVENPDASFREPAATKTRSAAPDAEELDAIFRALGARVDGDTRGTKGSKSAKRPAVRVTWKVDHGDTSAVSNAHLHAWLHRAIEALELLHAKHPIDELSVHGFE